MYEQQRVYEDAHVSIDVRAEFDPDANPMDADCHSDADITAWTRDEWSYVSVSAHVELDGVEVGHDSLSGVEHGQMSDQAVDAFELIPATTDGNAVTAGSAAWSVCAEALANAGTWLTAHSASTEALSGALAWLPAAGQ